MIKRRLLHSLEFRDFNLLDWIKNGGFSHLCNLIHSWLDGGDGFIFSQEEEGEEMSVMKTNARNKSYCRKRMRRDKDVLYKLS